MHHSAPARSPKRQFLNVLHMPKEALRGVPLATLLDGNAALFKERGKAAREDPKGTFAKSLEVKSLEYFCSHSWACSRALKYAALLMHFNLGAAMKVTAIVHTICFSVQLFFGDHRWMAAFTMPQPRPTDLIICNGCYNAMLCESLGPLAFFITLLTAHRFRPFTGAPPINVFLDICCIAQDDEKAKAVGIASIGAILDRSQRMLALISGDYFNRLWCTFELAAYHRRAGRSRLDLVPLSTPLRFIGLFVMFSCFYEITVLTTYATAFLFPYSADKSSDASSFFYDGGGDFVGIGLLVIVLCAPGFVVLLHAAVEARDVHRGLMRLHDFDLRRDAHCFSPSDREALLDVIADWFSDVNSGETDVAGLRRLGIHRFQSFVRFELAPELTSSSAGVEGNSNIAEVSAAMQLTIVGWALDTFSMPGLHLDDVWSLLAMAGFTAAFMLPCTAWISHRCAAVVVARRERYGNTLAYTAGLVCALPFFFATAALLWASAEPSKWGVDISGVGSDAGWDAGAIDDGLDTIGRKVRKWQIFMTMACAVVVGARFYRSS